MKILVTSGGTKIPIDRVRDITNMSKGTFGSKIAYELLKFGHEVLFFRATYSCSPMSVDIDLVKGYNMGDFTSWYNERSKFLSLYSEAAYSTFDEYSDGLEKLIKKEDPDVVLLAAAVSDYGVSNFVDGKVRSTDNDFNIILKPLPKLITKVKEWAPKTKLVGFKLLVDSTEEQLLDAAKKSIEDNNCDMVVANDLSDMKRGEHTIRLVFSKKEPRVFKTDHKDPNYLARIVASNCTSL